MNKKIITIVAGVISLIVIGFISFLLSDQIIALYNGAVPRTEDFTELYFEDHEQLPKTASPGAELHFNYTVHNLEHKSVMYPVNIYVESDADLPETTLVGTSNFTLQNNESKVLTSSFVYPDSVTLRSKIIVKLMNLDQTISFWVNIPVQATLSAKEARNPIIEPDEPYIQN